MKAFQNAVQASPLPTDGKLGFSFRMIEPLWMYLSRMGYSNEFRARVLEPALTPLFVTKEGTMFVFHTPARGGDEVPTAHEDSPRGNGEESSSYRMILSSPQDNMVEKLPKIFTEV